ncbi:universal stress protein [bacterium]|nr:universal stress protein [bacterium]
MSNPSHRHPRYLLRDQLDALHEVSAREQEGSRPKLSRVLVPLDGSYLASRILPFVRGVLAGRNVEVMLLRVLSDAEVAAARESVIETACAALDELRSRLLSTGAEVRYDLMTGDPAERILTFARSYRPSLIAMATHGRGGISRLVRGSVTEHLLRHSTFPVLAASPPGLDEVEKPHLLSLRSILVPLDGSERSAGILPLVSELAQRHASTVTLLHVSEPYGLPLELQVYEETADEGVGILEPIRLALREQGVPARGVIVRGRAATAIQRVARDERSDLVAMATHGRTGLARLVFGSVAEEVLRSCPCPVLLGRTAEHEAPVATPSETVSVGLAPAP